MSNGNECCPEKPDLTLGRIAFKREEWKGARGVTLAEISAEIQGPDKGSKCCPDSKGVEPAIVFILKLDSIGNKTTCDLLNKNFAAPTPGYSIDTDGANMTVTFRGDCDPAKQIDGVVTASIRIPITCPTTSTPRCSCTFDKKKRTTKVTYGNVTRYEVEWHAEVVPKAGEDCVIEKINAEIDKFTPKGL
jgi:hypothetical protein